VYFGLYNRVYRGNRTKVFHVMCPGSYPGKIFGLKSWESFPKNLEPENLDFNFVNFFNFIANIFKM